MNGRSELRLRVRMRPMGQERARHATRVSATGQRYAVTYTPPKTVAARRAILEEWISAGRPVVPDDAPFECEVVATWKRPASHLKRDGSLNLRGEAMPYPRRPDVDNVLKLVLDALQPECIRDDDRCHAASIRKAYGDEDCLEIALRW